MIAQTTKMSDEMIQLGLLSARKMRERMSAIDLVMIPILDSGWTGTLKELAGKVGAVEKTTYYCVLNYADAHPSWPRSNVTK